MKRFNTNFFHALLLFLTLACLPWTDSRAALLGLVSSPLYLSSPVLPRVMLVMSRDHELSRKAYTDYTDLNGDGTLDTTYTDNVTYYGYFDSDKCYTYSTTNLRFEPSAAATGTNSHECSSAWSGNFLNWASMTRLDVVRKVLYGGFRSTDSTGTALGATVLERAFLPPDVHAFAKIYAPAGGATDVAKFTPYSVASVSLCNVSDMADNTQAGSGISTVNGVATATPPLIKVASGSWPTWAMTEIFQCKWDEQTVEASPRPSTATHRLTGSSDLVARVAVCVPSVGTLDAKCKSYYTRDATPVQTVKPTGLLQQYGDVDATRRVQFGLITGSYKKNTSGGVLRKNIKLLSNNAATALTSTTVCGDNNANDEVNVCTGQFINQDAADKGIIKTLNLIHIAGYKTPAAGTITATQVCTSGYNQSAPFACSASSLLTPTDGTCVDWGNPLSEMYHEALRYFAGKTSATTAYNTDDSASTAVIAGLGVATWDSTSDPLPSAEWCALSNIIIFSTGLTSLDAATITSDITGITPATLTDAVGTAEGIAGNNYLIGSNGTTSDYLCNSKTLANLSNASGICPELPHMKGGYLVAGLAYANRSVDLRPGYATNRAARWSTTNSNWTARQPLSTYTVSLAENLPTFTPTVGGGTVTIVPACRNGTGTCSMTDLRVESYSATSASFLVSWEDGSAGSDYDMDAMSRIEYCVGATCNPVVNADQIRIKVSAVQSATGAGDMKLGYAVAGTSADGTYFPVRYGTTGACNPTDAGSAGNQGFFNLLTTPPTWRINNWTTWLACSGGAVGTADVPTTPPASSTSPVMPTSVRTAGTSAGACTACPANVTCPAAGQAGAWNTECGCPKLATFTRSAAPAAGLLKSPLWYAAKYGAQADSWDLKNNTTGALTPDSEPDNFFDVRNPADLYTSLANVFDAAATSESASSSAATSSTTLGTDTYLYAAKFKSSDWSGMLQAYLLSSVDGSVATTASWDAGTVINSQNYDTGRAIVTYNPVAATKGVPFRWASISTTQQGYLNRDPNNSNAVDALGSSRLDYLRGSATTEGTGSTQFRVRSSSKLGDIVNSSPYYVGAPNFGYSDHAYATFKSTYASRTPILYVGANDGMLHGFNASTGAETIAYVPNKIFANLNQLTSRSYNTSGNHRYFVDGSPTVGDAYINSAWKSVLVSGLGGGGRGIFALDVTNPTNFTESAANAGNLAMWEFTDANDSDLGFTFGQAAIVKVCQTWGTGAHAGECTSEKWAAIFGNGYNNTDSTAGVASATGKAALYILFIEDGASGWTLNTNFYKITTTGSTATPNGLATPAPIDADGDGYVDFVYAGDLQGNLVRFNLTGNANTWDYATLFTAQNATPTVQPITTRPEVGRHKTRGFMVYFGTGQYLATGDNVPTSQPTQTFYGIWDDTTNSSGSWSLGATVVSTRSSGTFHLLQQKVLIETTDSDGAGVRVTSDPSDSSTYAIDWTTHKGWYIDLYNTQDNNTNNYGEKQVTNSVLRNNQIEFTTLVPSTSLCLYGGTGWTMKLDPNDGSRIDYAPFLLNNGNQNMVTVSIGGVTRTVAVSGKASTVGILASPTIVSGISGSANRYEYTPGSTGRVQKETGNVGPSSSGRISWREILN